MTFCTASLLLSKAAFNLASRSTSRLAASSAAFEKSHSTVATVATVDTMPRKTLLFMATLSVAHAPLARLMSRIMPTKATRSADMPVSAALTPKALPMMSPKRIR